jgi:hypothetical protein
LATKQVATKIHQKNEKYMEKTSAQEILRAVHAQAGQSRWRELLLTGKKLVPQ